MTSFQYRNIGINISITPKVFVDGEIELELQLETSTQLETRIIGGIELPVFGTRQVNTVVRLRDGETNLIGGLIQQSDRRGTSGIPGLTDIPLLSRLFSNNDEESSSNDIVFSVTPHIVRAPRVTERDLAPLPMGTEQQIKVPGTRSNIFDPVQNAEPTPPEEEIGGPEEVIQQPEVTEQPVDVGRTAEPVAAEADAAGVAASDEPANQRTRPISILFSPPTATIAVGEQVDVVVLAGGALGLSAGELTITYDASAFRLFDVKPGAFLTIDGKTVDFTPTFNPGQVQIAFARQDDTTGLRGSGHLVRLSLEALPPSAARASVSVISARGSLLDPDGTSIPASFSSLRIEVQ